MNEPNQPDDDLMRDVDAVLRQREAGTQAEPVEQDKGSLVLMAMGQIDALVMQREESQSHAEDLHQKLLNEYGSTEYCGEPLYSGDPTALNHHAAKLAAHHRVLDSCREGEFILRYQEILDGFQKVNEAICRQLGAVPFATVSFQYLLARVEDNLSKDIPMLLGGIVLPSDNDRVFYSRTSKIRCTFVQFEHLDGCIAVWMRTHKHSDEDGEWQSSLTWDSWGNAPDACPERVVSRVQQLKEISTTLREIANARRKCDEIDKRIASYKKLVKGIVGVDLDDA